MKIHPFGIALIGAISYLTYHAIAGEQGLSRWTVMQNEVAELEATYQARLKYRNDLKNQTNRLYPESLDLDYLEELARTKFHFVRRDEFLLEPPRLTAQLPENEELFDLSN